MNVYDQVYEMIAPHIDDQVPEASRKRLALVVTGMLGAKSASPARIAQKLAELQLSEANAESIERRIRRLENDEQITDALCMHPFAREHLLYGKPKELLLILDPTCQDDRLVMVSVAVWYRGRALPLVWTIWQANTPLEGERFWARIKCLIDTLADLLPEGIAVTFLADSAFGTPAFTDLLKPYGFHYLVRVQGQTRYKKITGQEAPLSSLIQKGQRYKGRGLVFKKHHFRYASVVLYWGAAHKRPLLLVSDLPACFNLIALYKKRYPIEASFRDYKSHGWQWEQGQVIDQAHIERLLVAMALATWLAIYAGTQEAAGHLSKPPTGKRRTRPPQAKYSLFSMGLTWWQYAWKHGITETLPACLTDWQAPNWSEQITQHHTRAYVFAQTG